MDGSDSVNHDDPESFGVLQQALVTLTNQFVISSDRVLMGMIQFSDRSEVEVRLGSINSSAAMIDAINGLVYQNGQATVTEGALELAAEQFTLYGRPGVQKLLLLLTDDPPDNNADAQANANTLKDSGVTIISIGINLENGFERGALRNIATNDDLIEVTDVEDLSRRVTSDIIRRACPGKV